MPSRHREADVAGRLAAVGKIEYLCDCAMMRQYAGAMAADSRQVAERLAATLVRDIQDALRERDVARVVFSTGNTPVQTYSVLRASYARALPWDRVCVQQLDEYCGLSPSDPRLFCTFLRHQLVTPLGTLFSPLTGEESEADLAACDAALASAGGLDLVLFGVGVNGHLGFNEPGSRIDSPSRRVDLHASTRERIDIAAGPAPTQAVTLGLSTLCAARRVRVVALGHGKREAVRRGLLEPPGVDSPLSALQSHANVQYFLDMDAAPAGLVLA